MMHAEGHPRRHPRLHERSSASIIGVVITWQTLRGAILANIKEFASLRALGVSIGQPARRGDGAVASGSACSASPLSAVSMVGITCARQSANNVPMGFEVRIADPDRHPAAADLRSCRAP